MPALIDNGLFLLMGSGSAPHFADFWAAMESWVKANVPGLVGGLWFAEAPHKTPLPMAVYDTAGDAGRLTYMTRTASNRPAYVSGSFTIAVYAISKKAVNALARQVVAAVEDAPLVFDEGTLSFILADSIYRATKDPDPGPAPDYGGVYQTIVTVDYMFSRS